VSLAFVGPSRDGARSFGAVLAYGAPLMQGAFYERGHRHPHHRPELVQISEEGR